MAKEVQFMARIAVRVLLAVDDDGEVTGIELANAQSVTVDDFFASIDEEELEQLDREIRK